MRNTLKKLGKKVAVGGIVLAGGGVSANLGLDAYEDGQIENAVDHKVLKDKQGESEALIPDEKLSEEYKKAAVLRDIYGGIAGTRRSISKLGRFLVGVAPGAIKTNLETAPSFTFDDLDALGIQKDRFIPLVDLGAFDLQKLRTGNLDYSKLKEQNVKELVLWGSARL